MYACMYVCMYVCMHVYMYVCMYVCMYVWLHHLPALVRYQDHVTPRLYVFINIDESIESRPTNINKSYNYARINVCMHIIMHWTIYVYVCTCMY